MNEGEGSKVRDQWSRGERERDRWSRGEKKNRKLEAMGRARARASKKEKKEEFLGGGIEWNGDSGN